LFPYIGVSAMPERITKVEQNAANDASFESLYWLVRQMSSH
jgi:hypothetical protein